MEQDEDDHGDAASILQILFNLHDQRICESYSCAIIHRISWHGRLYLSRDYLSFYSNVFGIETKRVIHLSQLLSVRKVSRVVLLPYLELITAVGDSPVTFGGFFLTGRDKCYADVVELWEGFKRRGGPAEAAAAAAPAATAAQQQQQQRSASRVRARGAAGGGGGGGEAAGGEVPAPSQALGAAAATPARSRAPSSSPQSSAPPTPPSAAAPLVPQLRLPGASPSPSAPASAAASPAATPAPAPAQQPPHAGSAHHHPHRSVSLQPSSSRQRAAGGSSEAPLPAQHLPAHAPPPPPPPPPPPQLAFTAAPATALLREAPAALWTRLARARVLVDLCVPCTVAEFAALCLADDAPYGHRQFHEARGDTGFAAEAWREPALEVEVEEGAGGGSGGGGGGLSSVPTTARDRAAGAGAAAAAQGGSGGGGASAPGRTRSSVSLAALPSAAAAAAAAAGGGGGGGAERTLLDGQLRTRMLSYTMLLNNPLLAKDTLVTKLQRAQVHTVSASASASASASSGGGSVLVLDSYNTSSSTPYCDIFNTEETWVVCSSDTPLPLAGHALPPGAPGAPGGTRLLMACKLAWSKTIMLQTMVSSQVEAALKALGEDYVRGVAGHVAAARGRAGGGSLVAPRSSLLLAPPSEGGSGGRGAGGAEAPAPAPAQEEGWEEGEEEVVEGAASGRSRAAGSGGGDGGTGGAGGRGAWPREARELVAALEARLEARLEAAQHGGGGSGTVKAVGLRDATIGQLCSALAGLPAWVLAVVLGVLAVLALGRGAGGRGG